TNAPFEPAVEAVAIVGVEVFFVLSGFVLAPQIVDWVIAKPWRNLGVFLARRWMRTIPPYVAALAVVALMTGNLMTADTLRYLFYVENLVGSANATDYYPVAWSLAVEEWFYVLFAPLLFLVCRVLGRGDRRLEVAFAALFILAVAAPRAFAAPHDWDLDVRRATVFRVDSIVWGYLLYLALEKRPLLALKTVSAQRTFAMLGAALVAATALEFGVAVGAIDGNTVAQQAFPYSSALFGMSAVGFFRESDPLFRGRVVSVVSFWLGRISYSTYLFHIVVVMAVKPRIADWPLVAQLALYIALVCALSSVFWRGFERPILARRPGYAPRTLIRRLAPPSPASGRRDSPPLPLAGEGRGEGRSRLPAQLVDRRLQADEFALAAAAILELDLAFGEAPRTDQDLMRHAEEVERGEFRARPLIAIVVEHIDS